MIEDEEREVVTPVHRSLIRENLFMGCEPKLLMIVGSIPAIFIVVLQTPLTFFLGLVIFFGGIPIMQKLAKHDPMFTDIYIRHKSHLAHYDAVPSQSGILLAPFEEYKG